jgi:hypothetical protein
MPMTRLTWLYDEDHFVVLQCQRLGEAPFFLPPDTPRISPGSVICNWQRGVISILLLKPDVL